jgi:hypothetical protein
VLLVESRALSVDWAKLRKVYLSLSGASEGHKGRFLSSQCYLLACVLCIKWKLLQFKFTCSNSVWCVGTAHINSGAGQSQFRRHPMLSNGRINTFHSNEATRVAASTIRVSMEIVRQTMEINSRTRCLLHGRNKLYLSRNRYNTQHSDMKTQAERA